MSSCCDSIPAGSPTPCRPLALFLASPGRLQPEPTSRRTHLMRRLPEPDILNTYEQRSQHSHYGVTEGTFRPDQGIAGSSMLGHWRSALPWWRSSPLRHAAGTYLEIVQIPSRQLIITFGDRSLPCSARCPSGCSRGSDMSRNPSST